MADDAQTVEGRLLRLEQDVDRLKQAFQILGVRACSVCAHFFLASTPANLFVAGDALVCARCLSGWWQEHSPDVGIADRVAMEFRMARWLVEYHGAKVFRNLRELPLPEDRDLQLIASCHECRGTGRLGGQYCRFCGGNRNVWVIVPKRHATVISLST